jgi:hypothetical protein
MKINLQKSKQFAVLGGIAVIVVLIVILATMLSSQNPANPFDQFIKPKPQANKASNVTPTVQQTLSYDQAINMYANKRIQFDPNCTMIPSSVNFLKGVEVMLDNRFGSARTISLDGVKYNLSPYGFKIVTLTTNLGLPHTIKVDCGTGKNNGQITLQ